MTEDQLRDARRALGTAQACASGQLSAIEACWSLSLLAHSLPQLLSGDDRNLFVGVESETDALPVGKLKENWHPDYLPAKMEQLNRYEGTIPGDVRSACERLITALETELAKVEPQ